jgi:SAM-dependent methyltransferase
MHKTAHAFGAQFFGTYLAGRESRVLDVGSYDYNGTLRDCAPPGCEYVGVDLTPGPGVDIVLEDPYSYPLPDAAFDAVLSTSALEHDQFFWLSILEMARVLRPGGYLYLNAPSKGVYHPYPIDSWRFYPDAALSLAAWAGHQGRPIELLESFTGHDDVDGWADCIMVFCREPATSAPVGRIVDHFPNSRNIRRGADAPLKNVAGGPAAPPGPWRPIAARPRRLVGAVLRRLGLRAG